MARPWTINKSRRLEAACACDQMACSNDAAGIGPSSDIQNNVVGKPPMLALASAAFGAVYQFIDKYDTVREAWSEAAQLLRDGWSPGDSIVTMSERLEREAEKIIEAKHKELDAAGVPADAETLVFEETERVIDDGPTETAQYVQCEDPECPALEHPEDLHAHPAKQLADEMREGTASFDHGVQNETVDAANDVPTETSPAFADGDELINY